MKCNEFAVTFKPLNFVGVHFFLFRKHCYNFSTKKIIQFAAEEICRAIFGPPRLFRHKGHGSIDLEGVSGHAEETPGAAGF